MYDELIKEYAAKTFDTIKVGKKVNVETYEAILAEFLDKAQNVGQKKRPEYDPRA
jgi:hypothetical protein